MTNRTPWILDLEEQVRRIFLFFFFVFFLFLSLIISDSGEIRISNNKQKLDKMLEACMNTPPITLEQIKVFTAFNEIYY